MENYLMLDGKKYELSPDLVNALRSVDPVPEKETPFARALNKRYFTIDGNGEVSMTTDTYSPFDNDRFAVANYCTDRSLMEQRAMHETLDRLLWRYSEEHGGVPYGWTTFLPKYRIYMKKGSDEFAVDSNDAFKNQGAVYFETRETAISAIEEVIKPFMAAHPDFEW